METFLEYVTQISIISWNFCSVTYLFTYMQMWYYERESVCVCVYRVMLKYAFLAVVPIQETWKRLHWSSHLCLSPNPLPLLLPAPPSQTIHLGATSFLCFLTLRLPSICLFSPFFWLSFSISLHPSPFYLLLTLNSLFSFIAHRITYPRTNVVLWNLSHLRCKWRSLYCHLVVEF